MKIAVIVIIVLFLLVTCLGAGALALIGFGLWVSQGAEGAIVRAVVPADAVVGEAITLQVVVTNELDRQRTIGNIDIADAFLEGFNVLSVEPPAKSQSRIMGYTSYSIVTTVPPQGETTVTFTLEPAAPGSFVGDIDIYVDSDIQFETRTIQTVVTDTTPAGAP